MSVVGLTGPQALQPPRQPLNQEKCDYVGWFWGANQYQWIFIRDIAKFPKTVKHPNSANTYVLGSGTISATP